MTSHSEIKKNEKPILVFLPRSAAQVIVSKLVEYGYAATAVYSVPELFDALRSASYSLAVTTRPDIDMVRAIQSIPVVNLEVFFHTVGSTGNGVVASKQFDGKAFLERIRVLIEPRSSKGAAIDGNSQTNTNWNGARNQMFRWWAAAKPYLDGRVPAGAKK
ncbi:hypothetical protein [Pararhizobium sp. LjRoot238]|uniref:hypothetical protein n=1 Tax=Pararhizobium sp. LjRoot238 TaxID=3342293 RepID=UPI003ED00E6F